MILSELVPTMSPSPDIQNAVVLRRIGTASLIELRAPHGLGEHVAAATAHAAGDSLCIYQQLGAYRLDAAAVTALLLVALALAGFVLIERLVGGPARG